MTATSADFEAQLASEELVCASCGAKQNEDGEPRMYVYANALGERFVGCHACVYDRPSDAYMTEEERASIPLEHRMELVADLDGAGVHDRRRDHA